MFTNNIYSNIFRGLAVTALLGMNALLADTLNVVTSAGAQQANDTVAWSSVGPDGTLLNASGNVTSAKGATVKVSFTAANSVVSVACPHTPCSWTAAGFKSGDSLIWSSDASNGANGPVTVSFTNPIAGAGALIQADGPGPFTAKIEAFKGTASLGSFTVPSDSHGTALYVGVVDTTAANITSVVFSLTSVSAGLTTDFALDTLNIKTGGTTAPAVGLSATSLTYATPQLLNTKSSAKAVTVTNTGTATLTISSVASTGDYLQTSNCVTSLAPGGTCTINVTFQPTAINTRTGAVKITDNATGSPQSISLTGRGTEVKLSPSNQSFPATTVGMVSAAKTTTVTNVGSSSMSITSITLGGTNAADFSESNDCGSSLGAGKSCTITMKFQPKAKGAFTATVSLADNGGPSPQFVNLSGTGQ